MSIKFGSIFPRTSQDSQKPDSTLSKTSLYSQDTHSIPTALYRDTGTVASQAQPCCPPTSPRDSTSNSTRTLVASPDPITTLPERIWVPASHQGHGGERIETKNPRGVVSSPGAGGSQWQLALETILQYHFRNPDLLEEALESPGSGVVVVGRSNRVCVDGNEGLASVGLAVMKLVLKDQCYLFKIAENDFDSIITSILGWRNLDKLGRQTKIEKMIRPRKPVRPRRKHNILSLLKDDAQRENPTRTIARGMKAIVGAVYYDAGYEAARKVISQLGLMIKP